MNARRALAMIPCGTLLVALAVADVPYSPPLPKPPRDRNHNGIPDLAETRGHKFDFSAWPLKSNSTVSSRTPRSRNGSSICCYTGPGLGLTVWFYSPRIADCEEAQGRFLIYDHDKTLLGTLAIDYRTPIVLGAYYGDRGVDPHRLVIAGVHNADTLYGIVRR